MKDREPVGFLFENPDDPERQPDSFNYDATFAIWVTVICVGALIAAAVWIAGRV